MKTLKGLPLSSALLGGLLLSGCATDMNNDPKTGGLLGGVRGLNAGDYEARQQHLQERRDGSLQELRSLREQGGELEVQRQMKDEEVRWQRRQLGTLKKKNRSLAEKIGKLRQSKAATEERTMHIERQYALLTQNIDQFEAQLDQGKMSMEQAESRRLVLEEEYATLSSKL